MNWFSRFADHGNSSTTINVADKAVEVLCSARANKALAERDRPLIVELKLTFTCMARKQMHFHDTPGDRRVIDVNEKLGFLITVIIPNTCEVVIEANITPNNTARNFTPKWIRIDYSKGEWLGEYGL